MGTQSLWFVQGLASAPSLKVYDLAQQSNRLGKQLLMKSNIVAILVVILAVNVGFSQVTNFPKAKVSFDDFKGLVGEVETHRAGRLVDLNTFLKMSKEPGVIILDTRSTFRFERIHVKGATNLAFTDFTQGNLQKVIPSFETKILIYCNNNFDGNQKDFASKVALPRARPGNAVATQLAAQAKPIMMALNIPTYINLYGYGYRNVYELNELVNVNDRRIRFEGSIVEQKPSPVLPR
jgi:rhodanese-related sulfurtransferase